MGSSASTASSSIRDVPSTSSTEFSSTPRSSIDKAPGVRRVSSVRSSHKGLVNSPALEELERVREERMNKFKAKRERRSSRARSSKSSSAAAAAAGNYSAPSQGNDYAKDIGTGYVVAGRRNRPSSPPLLKGSAGTVSGATPTGVGGRRKNSMTRKEKGDSADGKRRDEHYKWNAYLDKVEERSMGYAVTTPNKKSTMRNSHMMLSPDSQSSDGEDDEEEGGEEEDSDEPRDSQASKGSLVDKDHHRQMKERIRRTVLEKKIRAKTKQLIAQKETAEMNEMTQKDRADQAEAELRKLRLQLESFKNSHPQQVSSPHPSSRGKPLSPTLKRNQSFATNISSDDDSDDDGANFSKPLPSPSVHKSGPPSVVGGGGGALTPVASGASQPFEAALKAQLHMSSSSEDEREDDRGRKSKKNNLLKTPTPKNSHHGSSTNSMQSFQHQQGYLGPDQHSVRKPPPPLQPGRSPMVSSPAYRGGGTPGGRGRGRGSRGGRGRGVRGGRGGRGGFFGRGGGPRGAVGPRGPHTPGRGSTLQSPKLKPAPPSQPKRRPKASDGFQAVGSPDDQHVSTLRSSESESDYSEAEIDEGEDEEVYDWFAFDTKAGLDSLAGGGGGATKEEKEVADQKQPTMTTTTTTATARAVAAPDDFEDESDDDYDISGEGDTEEVYDWTSMNTAAGMQEIEEKKNLKESASLPSLRAAATLEKSAPLTSVSIEAKKTPPKLAQQSSALTPANKKINQPKPQHHLHRPSVLSRPSMAHIAQSSATPTSPLTPMSPHIVDQASGPSTPDNKKVKDTNKVKRKKASLPTNKPQNAHGSWLTNRYIVNNYILLDPLGQGSYAEVRLCKEKTHDQLYAIKIMNKDLLMKKSVGMSSTFMDDVKREVAIMKKLEHENVLRLYEVMDDPKVNKMYLVLEYCKKGDLMQMTKGNARTNSCEPLPDIQVWDVMRQVLRGLKYLHDNDIVHGDLKPQNLLVDKNGVVKIADFGISKMIETSDGEKEKLLETSGTPAFMSPELCAGLAYDGYLADVYAVGATIFMLRCGHPPFIANKLIILYNKIQEDPVVFTQDGVGEGLKKLIDGMMEKDPTKRMTLLDVIRDPWVQLKPGDAKMKTPPSKAKLDIEKTKRIEVSSDEIFMSVHQVEQPSKDGVKNDRMDEKEQERRMKSFKKKASVRQRSFEKLDNLIEGANSENEDDDYGDDEDVVKVSKLDSAEFNSVMDTLAHQSPIAPRKKQAPLPHIVVDRVLDGLPNKQLNIRAAFYSERGKRPNQEDAVTVIMDLSDLGSALERPYLYQKFAFFGIYDGHSGGACSKLLQHKLHLKFAQSEIFFSDQSKAATDSCISVDEEICAELKDKDDESGSTALFLIIDGRSKKFTVSNVGDSRCVLSRGGTAIDLSKDHRLSRADEKERIKRVGGVVKNNRFNGVLAVSRSFGDVAHKPGNKSESSVGPLNAMPEIRTEAITDRDEFVLLATDGLWDIMDSQNAVNFLRLALNRHHKVKQAVKDLVREAIKLGSVDNVSAVVVVFNKSGDGD